MRGGLKRRRFGIASQKFRTMGAFKEVFFSANHGGDAKGRCFVICTRPRVSTVNCAVSYRVRRRRHRAPINFVAGYRRKAQASRTVEFLEEFFSSR